MNSVSLKFDSENWYPEYTKEIEVVIDKYTYLTIDNVSLYLNKINPEGYIKFDDTILKMVIEKSIHHLNRKVLRDIHEDYVKKNITHNKHYAFGFILEEDKDKDLYTLCTIKLFNSNDFAVFANFLLSKINQKQKRMMINDYFGVEQNIYGTRKGYKTSQGSL